MSCRGNCDLLSPSIKVKRKGEAKVGRGKITHSKKARWGRRIGHESVAAHFTFFASSDDAHIMSLSTRGTNKQTFQTGSFLAIKTTVSPAKKCSVSYLLTSEWRHKPFYFQTNAFEAKLHSLLKVVCIYLQSVVSSFSGKIFQAAVPIYQ